MLQLPDERIGRRYAAKQLFRIVLVEEEVDTLPGRDTKMKATLRTDLLVALQVLRIDDLATAIALHPEPLWHLTARSGLRRGLGLLRSSEPGHGENGAFASEPLPSGLCREVVSRSPTTKRFVSNTDPRWQSTKESWGDRDTGNLDAGRL